MLALICKEVTVALQCLREYVKPLSMVCRAFLAVLLSALLSRSSKLYLYCPCSFLGGALSQSSQHRLLVRALGDGSVNGRAGSKRAYRRKGDAEEPTSMAVSWQLLHFSTFQH